MAKVLLDLAMSLDGFITGPNGEDLGLHDYFFAPSGATTEVIEDGFKITGAIIMGKQAYEVGAAQGGYVDNPYQVPTFVLTHQRPEKVSPGAETFIFVTEGIESALNQAKAVVQDQYVVIGGGADISQQYLKAGLVDEIQIHLVSKLLCAGLRLFDNLNECPIQLETKRVIAGNGVTHLRYRVINEK